MADVSLSTLAHKDPFDIPVCGSFFHVSLVGGRLAILQLALSLLPPTHWQFRSLGLQKTVSIQKHEKRAKVSSEAFDPMLSVSGHRSDIFCLVLHISLSLGL